MKNTTTITSLAKHIGVSARTIYRRMDENGMKLDALRDSSGKLTPEGIAAISNLFDAVTHDAQDERTDVTREDGAQIDDMTHDTESGIRQTETKTHDAQSERTLLTQTLYEELSRLQAELSQVRAERDAARELASMAQENANQWRQQAEAAQELARQAQEMQMRLLPAPGSSQRGFFARLFKRDK